MNRPTAAGIALLIVSATWVFFHWGRAREPLDPSFVAARWDETMGAFNIEPVFPPLYIQPGDIFVMLDDPSEDANANDQSIYKRRIARLARADVRDALKRDAEKLLQLPTTTDTNPSQDIFDPPNKIVNLRPVGLMGFDIAAVREGDIGASLPAKVWHALFGTSVQDDVLLSIDIPNAQDLELPIDDAYTALGKYCFPVTARADRCSVQNPAIVTAILSLEDPANPPPKTTIPKIVLVTHVYYARRITYSYTRAGGAALSATASLAAKQAEADSSASPGVSPSSSSPKKTHAPQMSAPNPAAVDGSGAKKEAAASSTSTNNDDLGAIRSETSSHESEAIEQAKSVASSLGVAGGTINLVQANAEGTTFNQTFETPVAIGFQGIWIVPKGFDSIDGLGN